jgi:hypothetical protein
MHLHELRLCTVYRIVSVHAMTVNFEKEVELHFGINLSGFPHTLAAFSSE